MKAMDFAGKLKFQINTHKRRDGFALHSTLLLFPLRYDTLNEAVNYARFLGRDRGCEISIRDSKDNVIDEIEIDARHNQWINPPPPDRLWKAVSEPKRRVRKQSRIAGCCLKQKRSRKAKSPVEFLPYC